MTLVGVGGCRRMGLQEALTRLRDAGGPAAETAGLIEHVGLDPVEVDDSLLYARYGFREHVSLGGKPLLPGAEDFPEEFIQENGFPFGFVVVNALSVEIPSATKRLDGATEILAILRPGAPIGLFELFTHQEGPTSLPLQPWTIVAGTANVYPVCNVVNKTRGGELRKEYGEGVDLNGFTPARIFADSLDLFTKWREMRSDWSVDLVFLSRSLVERLGLTKNPFDLTIEQSRLVARLGRVAIERLASSRSYFDGLWHVFKRGTENAPAQNEREQAFEFWSRILSCAYGHRVSYEITDSANEVFPVTAAVEFLAPLRSSGFDSFPLLTPTVAEGDVCFIPVSEIVSVENPQDVVRLCQYVRSAYNAIGHESLIIGPEIFFSSIQMCLSKSHRSNHEYSSWDSYWKLDGKTLNTRAQPTSIPAEVFFGANWIKDGKSGSTHICFLSVQNALIKIDRKKIIGGNA